MEIQAIVDRLNEPPFSKHLSLVTFDEQTPLELLGTMSDVLRTISTDYSAPPGGREDAFSAATRVANCLRILNYRAAVDFDALVAGLQAGDHAVVFPALHWLLENIEPAKKRAYLAKFLVPVDVPEDLFMDEQIVEVFEQYKQVKQEFIETHKAVDQTRGDAVDPAAARQEISRLDQEKDQLQAKTGSLAQRLKSTPGYDDMLSVISKLRRELDEEVKLKTTLKQQQAQLSDVEDRHAKLSQRLRDLQSTRLSGGSIALLEKLREETQGNAKRCREELPAELERRKDREMLVRSSLSVTHSEADVSAVQRDIESIETELDSLRRQRDEADQSEDKNLKLFRQQAALVAKKKAEVADRLHAVTQERTTLEGEVSEQGKKFQQVLGTSKLLKGDQFTKYAASLRTKHEQRKVLKARLNAAKVEVGVLARTEEVLHQRLGDIGEEVDQLEQARGISGHQDLQETIEKVSKDKANVDQAKGQVLDEISRVVERLHTEIRERKTALAPLVKKLRSTRTQFQEVESGYLEKKVVYDNIKAGLDSKMSEVQREVQSLRADCLVEESRFHFLHAMLSVQEGMLSRAKDEAEGLATKNWRTSYKEEIQRLEKENRALAEKQKSIKASHEPNMRQLQLFRDVKTLLRMKVETLKKGLAGPPPGVGLAGASGMGGGVVPAPMFDYNGAERFTLQ